MKIFVEYEINENDFFKEVEILNKVKLKKRIMDGLDFKKKMKYLKTAARSEIGYCKFNKEIFMTIIGNYKSKRRIGEIYKDYMLQTDKAISYKTFTRAIKRLYLKEIIDTDIKIGGRLGSTTYIWLKKSE